MQPSPDTIEIAAFRFDADRIVPNNPALPALVYKAALDPSPPVKEWQALLIANGWRRTWVYTVYPYPHYHSNAHEVLAVSRGRATLRLGGESGQAVEVAAGDVVLLPAGCGHQRLDVSEDFEVVGAYPQGQEDRDLIRADTAGPEVYAAAQSRIAEVARPESDPIYGEDGPLLQYW